MDRTFFFHVRGKAGGGGARERRGGEKRVQEGWHFCKNYLIKKFTSPWLIW